MPLTIAAEGPCIGHECDNCSTCRRGRCCRRDNPNYKLPELGSWSGTIYGQLGTFTEDMNGVQCHCCGEFFQSLGTHAWQKHNLTAKEYRAVFGLRARRSLITAGLHLRLQASAVERREILLNNIKPGGGLTPEQISALRTGAHRRLEVSQDKTYQASMQAAGIKGTNTLREKRAAGLIPPPSTDHMNTPEVRVRALAWKKDADRVHAAGQKAAEALRRYYAANPKTISDEVKRKLSEAGKRRGIKRELIDAATAARKAKALLRTDAERLEARRKAGREWWARNKDKVNLRRKELSSGDRGGGSED